jgi:hypothetical protein
MKDTAIQLEILTGLEAVSQPGSSTWRDFSPLERAILWTIAYADVFDYPLQAEEIHRYLIGHSAGVEQIRETLSAGRLVPDYLTRAGHYYLLPGREQILAVRARRAAFSRSLWTQAERYGRIIARLPYVRMVAITGALAMNNVEDRPDIDYLVAVSPGRVWTCRAMIIALVRWASLNDITLCPNYILSTSSLALHHQDLYTAHELAQMAVLSGTDVYARLRALNSWTDYFLPNASGLPVSPFAARDRTPSRLSLAGERLLATWPGDRLESWEMRRKIAKFQRRWGRGAESDFCAEWCKGHFENHGQKTMSAFERRLAGLAALAGLEGKP